MPGQRKRKRRKQEEFQAAAAARRAEYAAAQWQVIYQTQDYDEWQAHLRRLRAERPYGDETELRIDTFCGRLVHPTTYRLSVRVPPGPGGPA